MNANAFIIGVGIYAVLLILGALLCTAAWVMMALWVHRDAENKNIDSPGMWAVLAGLTGVIGLVIYFAVNSQQRKNPQYPLVDGVPQIPEQKSNKTFMTLFIILLAAGVLLMLIGVLVFVFAMIGMTNMYSPHYFY